MVITSDFFTGLEKQETQAHGHKAQHKHRRQPDADIRFNETHCETPFTVVAMSETLHLPVTPILPNRRPKPASVRLVQRSAFIRSYFMGQQ